MIKCVFLGYMWRVASAIRATPGYDLVSVGIEPQRARSRAIETFCADADQKYFDARRVRDNLEFERLLNNGIDLLIVGAFGQILSGDILKRLRFGSVNFHPSRLPSYRGGTPLEEQILQGESQGGVTAHWLSEEVGRGPVIAIEQMPLEPDDDYISLYERSHGVAEGLMKRLLSSHPSSCPRVESVVETPIWKPRSAEDGRIDWTLSANKIHRLVRALGWRDWVRSPISLDKFLVVEEAQIVTREPRDWIPGTLLQTCPHPLVGTGEGLLRLTRFRSDAPLAIGSVLGSGSAGD